ncbi:MAG: OsmC family peroxiredoxin, partial [Actinomycetes bacterium]
MAATRSANAVWNGNLTEGSGTTSLATSGLGTFDVTWKARTEAANGKTSPEELIAAAHAACFSMALSNGLAKAGTNYFAGTLSDRYGRKPVLITGWLIAFPVPVLLIFGP